MRRILSQIDAFGVQSAEFAQRFIDVGAPAPKVNVTGSIKYDGVETDRHNAATTALRKMIGIQPRDLVWIAGSTSDPEERIVLDAYAQLHKKHPALRLILVPRHKERFDEVAAAIKGRGHSLRRRSEMTNATGCANGVVLVDTIGELSAVWGLADIAFVGGTFAPRGGQNMIEPAGYGAAVVLGPGVWNFQETVNHLLACGGTVQVSTADELMGVLDRLAADANERQKYGNAARRFVVTQHGATDRTIRILEDLIPIPDTLSVGVPSRVESRAA
jgi:3-deoxy-D-manno-octulosonic-acid transferase